MILPWRNRRDPSTWPLPRTRRQGTCIFPGAGEQAANGEWRGEGSVNLLAIETSTEACSVALLCRGEIQARHERAPRRHAELVLPWADALLASAGLARSQLDAIAVGRGPGAFTGVRLAIALAQGMALALDRPVLPISTLAALAMQAKGDETAPEAPILAAIDARMGEVYLGIFRRDAAGLVVALDEERLGAPETIDIPGYAAWQGVGTGFAANQDALQRRLAARLLSCDASALPQAADVARLAASDFRRGLGIAPDLLEPAYLRDKVALTIAEQGDARLVKAGGLP
jgi:tRNA threonylcarbamoyladenosine biosynthesis protein TsaB